MSFKRKAPPASSPPTPGSPAGPTISRQAILNLGRRPPLGSSSSATLSSGPAIPVSSLSFDQRGAALTQLLAHATVGGTVRTVIRQVVEEPKRVAQAALDDSAKSLKSRIRTMVRKAGEEWKRERGEAAVPGEEGEQDASVPPSPASALVPLVPLIASLPTDHPHPRSPTALSVSTYLLLFLFSQLPESLRASTFPSPEASTTPAEDEFLALLDEALAGLLAVRAQAEKGFEAESELIEMEGKGKATRRLLKKSAAKLEEMMEEDVAGGLVLGK